MKNKLYKFDILIVIKPGICYDKNEIKIDMVDILAENDMNMVLDDLHYTTIRKQKGDFGTCLNIPSISLWNGDNCFGTSIHYVLYSNVKKRISTIKKEIESRVYEKFGEWVSVDLSILDTIGDGDG